LPAVCDLRLRPRAARNSPPQSSLLAVEALTGKVLDSLPIAGRSVAGPVVSRGRVYVGFGNRAVPEIGPVYQGGLKAYGLSPVAR